jgi:hypothetical protein
VRHPGAPLLLAATLAVVAMPRGAAAQGPRAGARDRPWIAWPVAAPPQRPFHTGPGGLAARWRLPRPARLLPRDLAPPDLALAAAFAAALWVDAAQTREAARRGWRGWRETNPLLGPRPGIGSITAYTVAAGVTTLGVAAALPRPWRRAWLAGACAVELTAVGGAVRAGLGVPLR